MKLAEDLFQKFNIRVYSMAINMGKIDERVHKPKIRKLWPYDRLC